MKPSKPIKLKARNLKGISAVVTSPEEALEAVNETN
jgi:hypothetical protein